MLESLLGGTFQQSLLRDLRFGAKTKKHKKMRNIEARPIARTQKKGSKNPIAESTQTFAAPHVPGVADTRPLRPDRYHPRPKDLPGLEP